MSDNSNGHWQLDKRVPLALIGALLTQTLMFGVWVGSLQADMNQQWQYIRELRDARAAATNEERRITELLARLDERIRAQGEVLARLERGANISGTGVRGQ